MSDEVTDLYEISFQASRTAGNAVEDVANLGVVRAASHDEAVGKAYRIAMKVLPPVEGWSNHVADAVRADAGREIDQWHGCSI